MQEVRRRLDFRERLQQLLAYQGIREQRPANSADSSVCFKRLLAGAAQMAVQSLGEQSFELAALDPVFGFAWHHITCLYVR
jgi:hypothetical protein